MGVIYKLKQKFKNRKLAKQAHKSTEEWQELYKKLQEHPLTQAKIFNEQILAETNETLKQIQAKILDIDTRLIHVENHIFSKKVGKKKNVEVRERVIVPFANLSEHEKNIIAFIRENKTCDANSIAEALNISRSNASLKLNKLFNWNFLEKSMDDKRVTFSLKTEPLKD